MIQCVGTHTEKLVICDVGIYGINLCSMPSFPRTLADLKTGDGAMSSSQSFYGSLKELRRATLSIPNRLRSILKDAEFVQEVAAEYKLPLVANERCGSWYIPSEMKVGSAYFKSTDGHMGQWTLSLRRLNLSVLDTVGQHRGCIVVDSTRRGKVMPDAFSKTVPIWCAVINRALFPEQRQLHHFQLPRLDLPASEISQIESRLDDFLRGFRDLGLDLAALRQRLGRPIRLQWVIGHSTHTLSAYDSNVEERDTSCHNVILCSASRRVEGAEMSEAGYIQGAGDDSEGWSRGLTPQMFWRHKDMLLQAQEDELPELIKELFLEEAIIRKPHDAVLIEPTKNLYIGSQTGFEDELDFDLVITCNNSEPDTQDGPKQLNVKCNSGKIGSRELRHKLHAVKSCAASALERNPACRILIICKTGKDLSVGVALMLLCLFYFCDGRCLYEAHGDDVSAMRGTTNIPSGFQQRQKVDKGFIRQRLAWITSSVPAANPSRSTLQSINAYLMNRP